MSKPGPDIRNFFKAVGVCRSLLTSGYCDPIFCILELISDILNIIIDANNSSERSNRPLRVLLRKRRPLRAKTSSLYLMTMEMVCYGLPSIH
jgi:hypothetical protein